MMTRFIQILALLLLANTACATPQQLLTELQQMRLISTNIVTNFYMFTGLDADAKYNRKMQQAIEKFEASMKNANELAEANNVTGNMASINSEWQRFSALLDTNRKDMVSNGFPEVLLVDDMDRSGQQIVKQLTDTYEQVQESSGIKPPAAVEQSRNLALLMEEITSQYTARATTNLGQVFMGNSERSLEQMADEFQLGLDELQQTLANKGADNILQNINSKWRFMSNSVKNYNENTVLFLVVSYNDRILMHLKELEERFQ
ncbi:hypothetical protein [Bacterioplanoides sp.]|uniref:hypothetical protein n=1 Tax=Bacterioplanoides sp. TaxID=2066072 RepID=UPI003AFFDE79